MKVFLDTIGCRLNQSEVEKIAGSFYAAGHEIVSSAGEADLVIINTCAVTNNAVADSRQSINRSIRSGQAQVVVTGCWATLEPDVVMALDGVIKVFPNIQKNALVSDLLGETADYGARAVLPGNKMRTRAFIKAQDGCNNACSFCVTHIARGKSVSTAVQDIIADVNSAVESGVKEVVLTGVNLGSWGRDLVKPTRLKQLIKIILHDTDIPRLRLSSLEPWDLDEDFFELWEDKRLCRHLHLSLQSGCDRTLHAMRRRGGTTEYRAIVEAARVVSPQIAITTDVIVGFPGETEVDFNESCRFIEEIEFAGGHVFTYSPRERTPAYSMPDQIASQEKKQRSKIMKSLFSQLAEAYALQFLGQPVEVLWESAVKGDDGIWQLSGLSDNYLRVRSTSRNNLRNKISEVRLSHVDKSGSHGSIIPS